MIGALTAAAYAGSAGSLEPARRAPAAGRIGAVAALSGGPRHGAGCLDAAARVLDPEPGGDAADDHQQPGDQRRRGGRPRSRRRSALRDAGASAGGSLSVSGTASGCSFASATAPSPRAERPVAELGVEPGAELGRDHRAEHGDRQQAGDPRDAVVDPGGDADAALRDRVEHGRGQRRHRRREAEAEDEHRRQHVGEVGRRRADPQHQQQPDAADDRPDGHRQPRPGARGEPAQARREEEEDERDRRRRQPRLERRVADDLLEEEADEEEAADQAGVGGERGQVGDREVADPEQRRGRASGGAARASWRTKSGEAGHAGDQRHPDQRVAPAVGRLLDQGEDRPAEPRGREQRCRASRCRGRRPGRGSPRPRAGSARRSRRSAGC